MAPKYKGRLCSVFTCSEMNGNICCADCPNRQSCDDPCLNHPSKCNLAISKTNGRVVTRRFTDSEAFELWQHGYTDAQIAEILGVSRQRIQTWRDDIELPSTAKHNIDTKKYRLAYMPDGTCYVICLEECEF